MKHFRVQGPITSREFDIEDDEMLQTYILKINDYDKLQKVIFPLKTFKEQNIVISDNQII